MQILFKCLIYTRENSWIDQGHIITLIPNYKVVL